MHRATRRAIAIAVVLLVWLCQAPARADVVFGSKERCPIGSAGQLSHTGPWCAPVGCSADADCDQFFERDQSDQTVKAPKEPMVCLEYSLCVKSESVTQVGGWAGGSTITKHIARGPCDPGSRCTDGATCSRDRYCIPKRLAQAASAPTPPADPSPAAGERPPEGPPAEASSCGRCGPGGGVGSSGALAAVASSVAALALRRIRRRKASSPR